TFRHLPTSTLFPYTTLFRSGHFQNLDSEPPRCSFRAQVSAGLTGIARRNAGQSRRFRPLSLHRQLVSHLGAGSDPQESRAAARSDRKSTRLNSSHVSISYAV